jgi:hypothetical protein
MGSDLQRGGSKALLVTRSVALDESLQLFAGCHCRLLHRKDWPVWGRGCFHTLLRLGQPTTCVLPPPASDIQAWLLLIVADEEACSIVNYLRRL